LRGHPIHPLLVPLTVGTFAAAVIADIGFAATHDPFWARSAAWLLPTSLVAGCATGMAGAADLISVDRARQLPIARWHAAGNSLFLILLAWDYYRRLGHPDTVPSGSLGLTLVALLVMGVSGWLGGSMVFRHGIGVSPGVGLENDPAVVDLDQSRLAARAEATVGEGLERGTASYRPAGSVREPGR
jgi:uncharacterized membrane protein